MFPPEVQAAIETVLPSEDPLDSPDLDVVTYINKMFPTEASLAGLEDSMSCLQLQVTLLVILNKSNRFACAWRLYVSKIKTLDMPFPDR